MQFSVDGTVLAQAFNSIIKVIGKSDAASLSIKTVKKKPGFLRIRGTNDGRYAVLDLRIVELKGEFEFSADFDRLVAVSNKRSLLEFTLTEKGGNLEYKSKHTSYSGYISTVAATPMDIPSIDEADSKQVSGAMVMALFDMFKYVSLVPSLIQKDMLLFVEVDKGGVIRVASSDDYHLGIVERFPDKDTEKSKAESACLPFAYVNLITIFRHLAYLPAFSCTTISY